MEPEIAQVTAYVIAGIGLFVWLISLQFVLNTANLQKRNPSDHAPPVDWTESRYDNILSGSLEVDGKPPELANKTANILASPRTSPIGPVRITQKRSDRIAFEWAGPILPGRPPGPLSRRGELQFFMDSGKTRVDYALEVPMRKGLLVGAAVFLVLGLIALFVGLWIIQTHVVGHPNPGVRWQAVQMVQCVHFLWPPFLFAGLYRTSIRAARTGIETMVHNLPHVQI